MIRVGQREFAIPLWLWAALPLAVVLYVCVELGLSHGMDSIRLMLQAADQNFLTIMARLATAALTAFLVIDLARRSRTPWYGVPLLYFAAGVAAIFVVADCISWYMEEVTRRTVGAALMIAGSTRGGGSGVVVLYVMMLGVPIVLAAKVALLLTLACRFIAGLPLLSADTRREYWANLGGVGVWLLTAFGGYVAIRSAYGIALGAPRDAVPRWLLLTAASGSALVATALHLYLAHRQRRRQTSEGSLRVWVLVGLFVISYFYRPELFGSQAISAYYDHVRPAMRAVHLLPTPALEVAGYKLLVPFHDFRTPRGAPHKDGGVTNVGTPLPSEYGLTSPNAKPYVSILRRDATGNNWWMSQRKALDAAQAEKPGEDAIVPLPGARPALLLRTAAYPELEFRLSDFDPATPWDVAERTLRRFLQERLQRVN